MGLKHEADAPVPEGRQGLFSQMDHLGTVDGKAAAVGGKEGSQNLEEGGFSGSGGAHNGHHLPFRRSKIHAFQHLQGAEAFSDIPCFQNHLYLQRYKF